MRPWQRGYWKLQNEAEQAAETARDLSRNLDALNTAQKAAVEALREESKSLIQVLRSNGPNYVAKGNIGVDEVMHPDVWKALPSPKPALATDHLVALDRISKRPEINRLLALYAEASPAVKAEMKADLKALGDRADNLVRMNRVANGSKMKSNKSWHEVTYDQAKAYKYSVKDVENMRDLEDKALSSILEEIEKRTLQYAAEIKGAKAP